MKRAAANATTQKIMNSIRQLVQALRNSALQAERSQGLSGAQLFVLQKLADGRAPSLNELAERTLTHQSSVSEVVSKLVRKRLAARARSPVDGRRIVIALTPAGRRILRRAPETAQERLISSLERLSASERKTLARLLPRVLSGAGLAQAEPPLFFEKTRRAHAS